MQYYAKLSQYLCEILVCLELLQNIVALPTSYLLLVRFFLFEPNYFTVSANGVEQREIKVILAGRKKPALVISMLFHYVQKEYPNDHPTRQQVMQWLKEQKVHQIHSRPTPRLPTKSVVVLNPRVTTNVISQVHFQKIPGTITFLG